MMNDNQTAEPTSAQAHATDGGPVLVHIWEIVDPGHADIVVRRVEDMLAQVAAQPGYVSARVLESDDRRSIAAMIEMRSTEDRKGIERLPIVVDTLAHMDGTLNLVVRRYRERERL